MLWCLHSQTATNGDRWVYGKQGMVMGPATGKGKGLCMYFEGNKGNLTCLYEHLSANRPKPLPGGYSVGEMLYFTGGSQTANNGDRWVPGKQGKVMGPATGKLEGKGLSVYFDGNKGNLICYLTALSRDAPSYPSADHSPASTNTASQDKVALLSSSRRNAGCCSLQ